jgi:hypothetical protein
MDSLPKHGGKDPEQKEKLGMQLDKNLVAAQFATRWAQKFALRLTCLADQLEVGGIADMIWEIIGEILQSWVRVGFWRDNATIQESPSSINYGKCKDRANWQARKDAVASP